MPAAVPKLKIPRTFPVTGEFAYIPKGLIPFCVDIGSVKLDPKNPRINDEAAKQLAELLRIHGFRKPLVVDQHDIIRAGATAWKAANILGMHKIPIAKSDFTNEIMAKLYRDSDNKASEFSQWDTEMLLEFINDPAVMAFTQGREGLAKITGFTVEEIKGIAFEPDLMRINRTQESDERTHGKIIVKCNANSRDEIVSILRAWAKECGFENVEVL
jgi:hypothetical protein